MPIEDEGFRLPSVWDDPEEAEIPRPRSAPERSRLLLPLAEAQDALARLEASIEASSPAVAEGLRARIGFIEAAGWLAHVGAPAHPRDLALREAGLTGSYTIALAAGRLRREMPASFAEGELVETAPEDWAVNLALTHARRWRRLAEHASWQPLRSAETLQEELARFGVHDLEEDALANWLAELEGSRDRPAILVAAEIVQARAAGAGEGGADRPH